MLDELLKIEVADIRLKALENYWILHRLIELIEPKKGEKKMNEIERMEFLLARMFDGKQFLAKGYSTNIYYIEGNFYWVKPTGIEKMNMTLDLALILDFSLSPTHSFTDDVKTLMRLLPFDYIARNYDGGLWNYEYKPFKEDDVFWGDVGGQESSKSMHLFEHQFESIQFENDEPVNRKDYL